VIRIPSRDFVLVVRDETECGVKLSQKMRIPTKYIDELPDIEYLLRWQVKRNRGKHRMREWSTWYRPDSGPDSSILCSGLPNQPTIYSLKEKNTWPFMYLKWILLLMVRLHICVIKSFHYKRIARVFLLLRNSIRSLTIIIWKNLLTYKVADRVTIICRVTNI